MTTDSTRPSLFRRRRSAIACLLVVVSALALTWHLTKPLYPDNLLHGRMEPLPVDPLDTVVGWRTKDEIVLWRRGNLGSYQAADLVLRNLNADETSIPLKLPPGVTDLVSDSARLSPDGQSVFWVGSTSESLCLVVRRITPRAAAMRGFAKIRSQTFYDWPAWSRDNKRILAVLVPPNYDANPQPPRRFLALFDTALPPLDTRVTLNDPSTSARVLGDLPDGRILTFSHDTTQCVIQCQDLRNPSRPAVVYRYRLPQTSAAFVEATLSPDGSRLAMIVNYVETPSKLELAIKGLFHINDAFRVRHSIRVLRSDLSQDREAGYYVDRGGSDLMHMMDHVSDRHDLIWRDARHISLWCRGKYYSLEVGD